MRQHMKEYLKEYRKSQSNNVFKKIKKNDDLKSVEVNMVTKLIKDEVESSIDDDNHDGQNKIIGFR